MRYPAGHKQEVRERIVRAAAAVLRKEGVDGVSIPALMKQAGLTHGGFYSHFENRDELVAEALLAAGTETAEGPFREGLPLQETLRLYLSTAHVESPDRGCAVAALAADAVRQPSPVRKAFARVATGLLWLVEGKLHPDRSNARSSSRVVSDEALRLASTMVGAVVLARAVDDPALAGRLLKAARTLER